MAVGAASAAPGKPLKNNENFLVYGLAAGGFGAIMK
jgi:hypothetical protein